MTRAKTPAALFAALAALFVLSGCATVTGAAVGGGIGAVTSNGDPKAITSGAIIGGAAGTAAGILG